MIFVTASWFLRFTSLVFPPETTRTADGLIFAPIPPAALLPSCLLNAPAAIPKLTSTRGIMIVSPTYTGSPTTDFDDIKPSIPLNIEPSVPSIFIFAISISS